MTGVIMILVCSGNQVKNLNEKLSSLTFIPTSFVNHVELPRFQIFIMVKFALLKLIEQYLYPKRIKYGNLFNNDRYTMPSFLYRFWYDFGSFFSIVLLS